MPLLLPALAVVFFALGCIVDSGVAAWRRGLSSRRLHAALMENAALGEENERLRAELADAVPQIRGDWS